jgi:predicted P-loop ATPase
MYRKMLVRVAAAATCRIQFNKQCFVLKSDQNDGKSTWIRHHCPPALAKYRADWTRDEVSDKDGRFALAQNFMINLDELATFGKSNIEQTKALMSLDSIKDRPPYGKRPIRFPRRASFFGSTNKDEFLTDESGSVRWLVFEIAGIQHDNGGPNGYGEKVDINDVWAEAWYLLNQGEIEPMMSREDVVKSEARNKVFQVPTPEMELVGQHLKKTNSEEEKAEFLTVTEITNHLAGLTFLKLNKNFVGAALKHMGWEKVARFDKAKNFQVIGYWVKKETTQQSDFVENDENPKE